MKPLISLFFGFAAECKIALLRLEREGKREVFRTIRVFINAFHIDVFYLLLTFILTR